MIFITGLLQLIFIIWTFLFEFKKGSPSVFLWLTLLIVYSIPNFLYSSNVVPIEYDSYVLGTSSIFSLIFVLLYNVIRRYRHNSLITEGVFLIPRNRKMEIILFLALIFLVVSGAYVAYKSSGSLFDSSWSSRREYTSQKNGLGIDLPGFLKYPAASLILIALFYKEGWRKVTLFATLIFLFAMITRRRIDILPILVCFISYYIFLNNKLTLRMLLQFLILGSISLYVIYALQIYRYAGSMNSFIEMYSGNWGYFNERVLEKIFDGEGELGLQKAFYFFIYNENNYPGFGEGHTYLRMLLVFIPTSLTFGIKPPDFAITMGSFWNPLASSGFSMHPTLFGDAYANFGLLGALLGVFWGVFCNVLDKILLRNKTHLFFPLYILFGSCLIIIGRGSVYNSFFILIFSFFILKLINFFFLKKLN